MVACLLPSIPAESRAPKRIVIAGTLDLLFELARAFRAVRPAKGQEQKERRSGNNYVLL